MAGTKYFTQFENETFTLTVPSQNKWQFLPIAISFLIRVLGYVLILGFLLRYGLDRISTPSGTNERLSAFIHLGAAVVIILIALPHTFVQICVIMRRLWGKEVLDINKEQVRIKSLVAGLGKYKGYSSKNVQSIELMPILSNQIWILRVRTGGLIGVKVDE